MTAYPSTRSQWRTAAGWLLRAQLYLAVWFWVVVVGVAVVLLAAFSQRVDIELSALQFAHQGALWFPFAVSIVLVLGYLPVHVANGMTRRSFIRGSLVAAVATGSTHALSLALLLYLERTAYQRLGWTHGMATDNHQLALGEHLGAYLFGTVTLFVAGTVSGLLVGAAYYRFGGWGGTLLLPLALAPILLAGLVGLDAGTQWTPLSVTVEGVRWQLPVPGLSLIRPLVMVAVSVLGAGALHLILRRAPIASQDA